MKLLLIAGHGNGDPGACYNGHREADETRILATALGLELQKRGVVVAYYPMTNNAYDDYKHNTLLTTAKPTNYDYVLELHFNACSADSGDGKVKGTECYVTSLEKSCGVEEQIVKNMAALGFTNRGVKVHDYAVIKTLKRAGVSSALLEVCFIDDMDDMKLYLPNIDKVAATIADGICKGFGIEEVHSMKTDMEIAKELALAKGIIKGNEKGDPMWDKPLTREQMVTVLYRLGLLK